MKPSEALRKIEWMGHRSNSKCPRCLVCRRHDPSVCRRPDWSGHAPDCLVAAAIRDAEKLEAALDALHSNQCEQREAMDALHEDWDAVEKRGA